MADIFKLPSYPWHDEVWRSLWMRGHQLPHAMLLSGLSGLGKNAFAQRLAMTLLCSSPTAGGACGQCKDCRLLAAGTHPDLTVMTPDEGKSTIVVDQIRELSNFMVLKPHIASHKLIVVTPAEAMNINAANSLLKMLEEPPLGSIILLVSSHPHRLPVTVRSRCSTVGFRAPEQALAVAWLQTQEDRGDWALLLALAAGAPLTALSLAREGFLQDRQQLITDIKTLSTAEADPSTCADRWKKLGSERCLRWLQGLLADLIRLASGIHDPNLTNSDFSGQLHDLNKRLNLKRLYDYADVLSEARRLLTTTVDQQLLLEDLLIRWNRLYR